MFRSRDTLLRKGSGPNYSFTIQKIDGEFVMFCRLCVEGKKKNAFTTSSKVYKADSLHKHLTIKDHKNVVSLNNSNQKKIPDLFQRKKLGHLHHYNNHNNHHYYN